MTNNQHTLPAQTNASLDDLDSLDDFEGELLKYADTLVDHARQYVALPTERDSADAALTDIATLALDGMRGIEGIEDARQLRSNVTDHNDPAYDNYYNDHADAVTHAWNLLAAAQCALELAARVLNPKDATDEATWDTIANRLSEQITAEVPDLLLLAETPNDRLETTLLSELQHRSYQVFSTLNHGPYSAYAVVRAEEPTAEQMAGALIGLVALLIAIHVHGKARTFD